MSYISKIFQQLCHRCFSVTWVILCKISVIYVFMYSWRSYLFREDQRALRDTLASLTEQPEPRKPLPQTGSSGAQQLYRTSLSKKQTLRHHILHYDLNVKGKLTKLAPQKKHKQNYDHDMQYSNKIALDCPLETESQYLLRLKMCDRTSKSTGAKFKKIQQCQWPHLWK